MPSPRYATRMHAMSFGFVRNFDVDFDDEDSGGRGLWVYWNGGGLNAVLTAPGTIGIYTTDRWHHIAVVRSAGIVTTYIDGSSIGAFVEGAVIGQSNEDNYIGQAHPALAALMGHPGYWKGWLDAYRVTHEALWTSNFDPPTCQNGGYDCSPPCSDADADGICDADDPCPHDAANDADHDGICGDVDACSGTATSDPAAGVPSLSLGVNRWADVDGDGRFDTVSPKGKGPSLSFSLADTHGCSCAQIIAALGLGDGHTKYGCSTGALRDFIASF